MGWSSRLHIHAEAFASGFLPALWVEPQDLEEGPSEHPSLEEETANASKAWQVALCGASQVTLWARGAILTCSLFSQPAVELPPFNGSDLCVEGISVKKPKKQMPPITNLSFTDSFSDTTLKVRSPRALLDAAIGPSRMSLRQDWKREEAKVLSATWSVPVTAAEGRGQAKPTYAFSVSNGQDGDSKAPKSVFTRAQSTKHSDPNLTSVRHTAPVLQNTKTTGKPQSPPPRASGNRGEPVPCRPIIFEGFWLHPNPQRRPSSCILQNRTQGWMRGVP